MKLNQRQIDVFNSVMVNKSITAAAAKLGSSQPTLSREIREIESRLGFDLFLRFGKRLTPTQQAMLLHEVVLRSFVGLDEISRAASAICSALASDCGAPASGTVPAIRLATPWLRSSLDTRTTKPSGNSGCSAARACSASARVS